MDPKKHIKSCHSETIWDITKVPIKKRVADSGQCW